MNRAEFTKLLLENDQYWSSLSPAVVLTTPLLQLGLWTRHADSVGFPLSKSQRQRAKRLTESLSSELQRYHRNPKPNYPKSLAFIQARELLNELSERWLYKSAACRVLQFKPRSRE